MLACACLRAGSRCSTSRAGARSGRLSMKERPMAEVRLEQVAKHFGDVTAVTDVDLPSHDGGCVVLLRPAGAGKTTTLRLIAGLEKPDPGRVSIGGRDATPLSPME